MGGTKCPIVRGPRSVIRQPLRSTNFHNISTKNKRTVISLQESVLAGHRLNYSSLEYVRRLHERRAPTHRSSTKHSRCASKCQVGDRKKERKRERERRSGVVHHCACLTIVPIGHRHDISSRMLASQVINKVNSAPLVYKRQSSRPKSRSNAPSDVSETPRPLNTLTRRTRENLPWRGKTWTRTRGR